MSASQPVTNRQSTYTSTTYQYAHLSIWRGQDGQHYSWRSMQSLLKRQNAPTEHKNMDFKACAPEHLERAGWAAPNP
eukprot:1137465-Pelagomonas_calceolata.AAC.7